MSAIEDNPISTRIQAKQWYKFQLKRAPALTYFCQTIKIPTISAVESQAIQPTPFLNIPKSFDHVTFDPLVVNFQVDENLQNWLEIYNWMMALGTIVPSEINVRNGPFNPYGLYSDILVFILDSQYTPKYTITFEQAFPTNLGELTFDSTVKDTEYVYSEATFKYLKYTIDKA